MTIILPKYTGPGPQTLIGQYTDPNNLSRQHGFFGEVASSEFISGDALASAIGLTAGTSQNSTTLWLKFYIDGKIVYVPKKNLRHSISWQDIYQAGAIYGDGTLGLAAAGEPRVQDASVIIGKDVFKVMLIRGANVDPAIDKLGYDQPITHGSEWNRLFYNIGIADVSRGKKASQEGDQWANYSDTELDFNSKVNLGAITWCVESDSNTSYFRFNRGFHGISSLGRCTMDIFGGPTGWRPKLELVL